MIHNLLPQKAATANLQAAVSGLIAGATWVAPLAESLQIIATVVAIIAGLAATWYHYERALEIRKKHNDKEDAE